MPTKLSLGTLRARKFLFFHLFAAGPFPSRLSKYSNTHTHTWKPDTDVSDHTDPRRELCLHQHPQKHHPQHQTCSSSSSAYPGLQTLLKHPHPFPLQMHGHIILVVPQIFSWAVRLLLIQPQDSSPPTSSVFPDVSPPTLWLLQFEVPIKLQILINMHIYRFRLINQDKLD